VDGPGLLSEFIIVRNGTVNFDGWYDGRGQGDIRIQLKFWGGLQLLGGRGLGGTGLGGIGRIAIVASGGYLRRF
jgi:hypothetical protein